MTLLLSACLAASAASISHVRPAPHTYSGRVHAAAAVFGPAQERVAVKFTEQLGSAPADQHTGAISSLLDQQVSLFDNCLILSSCSIDDSCVVLEYPAFNKCDELLDAMNRLQQLLKERRSSAAGGLMGELLCFMSGLEGRLEDAATEVILVAKTFGPRHAAAAAEWVDALTVQQIEMDNAALLELRVPLFEEDNETRGARDALRVAVADFLSLRRSSDDSCCTARDEAGLHVLKEPSLLVHRAKPSTTRRGRDTKDQRQTNEYRMIIPSQLVDWGCDMALWRKVKNRNALRRLARLGDEIHGRQRIAKLRASLIDVKREA